MLYTYKQLLKNENNEYKFFEIDARKAESFKVPVGWCEPKELTEDNMILLSKKLMNIYCNNKKYRLECDEDEIYIKIVFLFQYSRVEVFNNGLIIEKNLEQNKKTFNKIENEIVKAFKNQ